MTVFWPWPGSVLFFGAIGLLVLTSTHKIRRRRALRGVAVALLIVCGLSIPANLMLQRLQHSTARWAPIHITLPAVAAVEEPTAEPTAEPEAIVLEATSGEPVFDNFATFKSGISGVLERLAREARIEGIDEDRLRNIIVHGIPDGWMTEEDCEAIAAGLANRHGIRLDFGWDDKPASPSAPRLDVEFRIEGARDGGSIAATTKSSASDPFRPLHVSAEYENLSWVDERDSDRGSVVGRSEMFASEEEALEAATRDAKLRYVDGVIDELTRARPELREDLEALESKIEVFLESHAHRVSKKFFQRSQSKDRESHRAAVRLDFPDEDLIEAVTSSDSDSGRRRLVRQARAGGALAILLVLASLFLDAGARRRYTWFVRFGTAVLFVGVCLAL